MPNRNGQPLPFPSYHEVCQGDTQYLILGSNVMLRVSKPQFGHCAWKRSSPQNGARNPHCLHPARRGLTPTIGPKPALQETVSAVAAISWHSFTRPVTSPRGAQGINSSHGLIVRLSSTPPYHESFNPNYDNYTLISSTSRRNNSSPPGPPIASG